MLTSLLPTATSDNRPEQHSLSTRHAPPPDKGTLSAVLSAGGALAAVPWDRFATSILPDVFRRMASSLQKSHSDGEVADASVASSVRRSSLWRNAIGYFQRKTRQQELASAIERRQHEVEVQLVKEQARQDIARLQHEKGLERESFQRHVQALQARIDAHEAQLHQAQVRSFADLARGGYTDEEDSTIVRDVRLLHQKLWTWARATCLPHMDVVRQAYNAAPDDFARGFVEAGVSRLLLDPARPQALKKLPALILAALVAEEIYRALFCNPFFFLNHIRPYPQRDRQWALCNTLELISRYHPQEAVQWRAQLLRTLHPSPQTVSGNSAAPSDLAQASAEGIVSACEGLVQDFLTRPDGRLLGESVSSGSGRPMQQLHQCYLQAGKLFTRLHGQTLELERYHAELLGQPYDARHMQPHSLHGSVDDGDDDKLEEMKVAVVVSPLLAKVTRREGTIHRHVLVKAVVCLAE